MSGGVSAGTLSMASAGMQVFGGIQRGQQESAMYGYQAAQAEVDAETARQLSAIEAKKIRKAGNRQQKTAVANLAASGVDVTSGTALKIPQSIAREAEEDAQMALLSGRYRGKSLDDSAAMQRVAGSNAEGAGWASAAGSLLSTVGTAKAKGWIE